MGSQIQGAQHLKLIDRLFKPKIPPRDEFVAAMAEEYRRRGSAPPVYDPVEFCFRFESGFVYLTNLFHSWQLTEPNERKSLVARFVNGFLSPKLKWTSLAAVRDALMPLVRSRAEISALSLACAGRHGGDGEQAWAPFAGDLGIALGLDHLDVIAHVKRSELSAIGESFGSVLPTALANLERRIPSVAFRPCGVGPGVFVAEDARDYQTSTLLLPIGRHFSFPALNGEPVVVPYARNALLLAGSRDQRALIALADFVAKTLDATPHRCSLRMLRRDGERWIAWLPDGEAGRAHQDALRKQDCQDYADQKFELEARHRETGQDVFVGSVMVLSRAEGDTTLAVWPDDVSDGWLPQAEHIVFRRRPDAGEGDAATSIQAPWVAAMPLVQHLLTPLPDLYPPRWRYAAGPDAKTLSALEALAVRSAQK